MKALIKSRPEPGIWLGELPKPEPGPNDVLIRMRKTAICGTDIHIWQWDDWAQRTIPVPMQVGHEYCGEIVALGSEVRGLAVGDRVSGEGHITCGHCRNCRAGRRHLCRNTQGVGVNRPGCFAEYMVLPASNVFRLPAGIPDEIASILDPLGNATHAALSFNMVGEDVLITGRGPDRHHGGRDRALHRRAPRRHHRRQRLPARPRAPHGRDPRAQREEREHRRRDARARHGGRLRRRPRDVGQRLGVPRHAARDAPRRQHRHARHPARRGRDRLEPGDLQGSRRSRASTAARCSRPGTRWRRCCRAGSTSAP